MAKSSADKNVSKIRIADVAKLVGIHVNTIRGWIRTGKLKSAEKYAAQGKGNDEWYVDLEEVKRIRFKGNPNLYKEYAKINPAPKSTVPNPNQIEALTQPFTAIIDKQAAEISTLQEARRQDALQIGQLKERLAELESRLHTSPATK